MEEGETPAILFRLKQRIHLAVETWATSHIERLKWSLPRAIHRMARATRDTKAAADGQGG